jgi:PAS domain S-box-containing protein
LDITARKDDEATFRTIFEDASVGIALVDPTGHFLRVNRAHAAMSGHTPEELVGRHFRELVPEHLREERVAEHEQQSADADVDGVEIPVPFERPDGSIGWTLVSYSIIRNAVGEPLHNVVQVRDISEQRRLEEQLRLAQKLESVGQLAAGIAHEINTPTQFIGDSVRFAADACADLLALVDAYEGALAGDDQRDRLDDARERADVPYLRDRLPAALGRAADGVDRVATIVRAMREFASPGGGDRELVDVNAALANTLVVTANRYNAIADVRTDFADVPPVRGNGGELNQVFVSLIVNAAQAIEDAGSDRGVITLSTRCDGEHVAITIADTGSGIAPEHRGRVFDPFFTTREVGQGTGQGLTTARAIIADRHAGAITLESEPGRGAAFTITLPAAHGDPAAPGTSVPA